MEETRVMEVGWDLAQTVPTQPGIDTLPLSKTELEILRLAARWMTTQEIAQELAYSTHIVRTHLDRILAKLHVGTRTQAVLYAIKKGWLP